MTVKLLLCLSLLVLSYQKTENSKKFLSKFVDIEETPVVLAEDNTKYINIKCLYTKNYNFYSLQSLQNKETDYEAKDGKVLFNFCQNTHHDVNATFVEVEGDSLVRLAGSIEGEGEHKNIWNEFPDGIQIDLVPGDECINETHHKTTIKMYCDADVEDSDFLNTLNFIDLDECTHVLEAKSLYGCNLRSMYLLQKLLEENKFVFGPIIIIIGLLLAFKGRSYFGIAMMIICCIFSCYALTAIILSSFPTFLTTEWHLLICLGLTGMAGLVVGYIIKKKPKICGFVIGGVVGFCGATFVYQIVQNYVDFDPNIVYYVTLGVCILIGAIIGLKLTDVIIILGTGIFGAYLAVRGTGLMIGNYLDEAYIIDLIKNKEFEQLKEMRDGWTYAYLGGWILISTLGIYWQCRNKSKRQKMGSYKALK